MLGAFLLAAGVATDCKNGGNSKTKLEGPVAVSFEPVKSALCFELDRPLLWLVKFTPIELGQVLRHSVASFASVLPIVFVEFAVSLQILPSSWEYRRKRCY